jgi:hypothetical protein
MTVCMTFQLHYMYSMHSRHTRVNVWFWPALEIIHILGEGDDLLGSGEENLGAGVLGPGLGLGSTRPLGNTCMNCTQKGERFV